MNIIKDDYGKDYKIEDLKLLKPIWKNSTQSMEKGMAVYMKKTVIGSESLKSFIKR